MCADHVPSGGVVVADVRDVHRQPLAAARDVAQQDGAVFPDRLGALGGHSGIEAALWSTNGDVLGVAGAAHDEDDEQDRDQRTRPR